MSWFKKKSLYFIRAKVTAYKLDPPEGGPRWESFEAGLCLKLDLTKFTDDHSVRRHIEIKFIEALTDFMNNPGTEYSGDHIISISKL